MNRLEKIQIIRNKLKNKRISVGTWMQIPHPSIAEILGKAGYDWVAIDLEHGAISSGKLPDLCRAIELGNTLPIVRLAQGTLINCKTALDSGAGGIIIPMIENAKQLIDCIQWSSWPPRGIRGVGFSRANLFGKEFQSYKEEATQPLIIAQIENIIAVNNLAEILAVPGLDAIMIGPYDLSASMGIIGNFESAEYKNTIYKIQNMAIQFGIPHGIHVVSPDPLELLDRKEEGYQFIAYSIDAVFLNRVALNPINIAINREE